MTAQEKLAELDREFNRPGSKMHLDQYRARRDELVREAASEPVAEAEAPAAPMVTFALLCNFAGEIGEILGRELRKRDARIAELEAKPNVAISASGNLQIDGMQHFADAVKALQRTLNKPMRPVYDESGKLIAAKRDE